MTKEQRKLLVFLAQRYRTARAYYNNVKDTNAPVYTVACRGGEMQEAWNTYQLAKRMVLRNESVVPAVPALFKKRNEVIL